MVYRARGVETLYEVVGVVEILAVAALVAEAPDDYRRMVLVALHERALTVEQRRFPRRLRGRVAGTAVGAVEVHAHAVGLGVGLVEHVDAILVAEVVPKGRLRIVAGAHGVEVVLLEHADIAHHGLAVYHMSVGLMVLMDIGAVDFHRFAVYEQLAVADFHRAESYPGRSGLHNVALGVLSVSTRV